MERVNSDDDADLSISSFATREPSALTEVRVHESNTTPGPFHSCTSSTQPFPRSRKEHLTTVTVEHKQHTWTFQRRRMEPTRTLTLKHKQYTRTFMCKQLSQLSDWGIAEHYSIHTRKWTALCPQNNTEPLLKQQPHWLRTWMNRAFHLHFV